MGVSMVTSLSLAISYPTLAAAPHMFINGYKNVLAIAVETDYSFPLADKVKEYLAVSTTKLVHVIDFQLSYYYCYLFIHLLYYMQDPSKFAVAAAPVAAAASGGAPAAAPAEEKKEEPEEESDGELGFSLFDD